MKERRGEKIGWTAGWIGGFIWIFVLSCVFLFQGKNGEGWSGIALSCIAVISVAYFAPWRFPSTPYWKLMLAPYCVFFLSVVWAVWAYGGLESSGLNWWNALWILPVLIPFGSLSKRKWIDPSVRNDTPSDTSAPRSRDARQQGRGRP
jgi:hypothetical protein